MRDVSILDPTCGSGAFLFAALNVLEPLYTACLEGMRGFLDDLEALREVPQPLTLLATSKMYWSRSAGTPQRAVLHPQVPSSSTTSTALTSWKRPWRYASCVYS